MEIFAIYRKQADIELEVQAESAKNRLIALLDKVTRLRSV